MKKQNRKTYKFLLIIIIGTLALTPFIPQTNAASYSFQVDKMTTNVFINYDGSIRIQYWINFTNYGQAIDWIDIGFPTDDYVLSSISASIDGTPISSSRIAKSSVIDIGVEVDLRGEMKFLRDTLRSFISKVSTEI